MLLEGGKFKLMEQLYEFLSPIGQDGALFLTSLVPFVELRGGIILGHALGMDWLRTFIICFLANCIPVPFVIFLARPIFSWLKKTKLFKGVIEKLEAKVHKKSGQVTAHKYAAIGLLLFVGIPLPGTGAYTGALIAALLDIRLKTAFPAIIAGIFLAGVIMTLGCTGVVSALSFLF